MIGEVIDHYRVLELIGRGAMGVVYKALDVNLDRLVAIKVMSAEVRSTPDFVERFRQEARLQAALNHPNVALLFDYFIHEGAPVAVMEFLEGESLEQMIQRRGAIPAHEGIPLFKQALCGVAAAHRAGIIHRDLKPSNLMITKDGVVKVMDFGIAKRQGTTGATKASTSIGSPLYMAPEQILGRTIDRRTDVYGLGITLYELLSGQPPFNPRGKAEFMVLNAHVNDLPEPPTVYRYGIPRPIVDAVMRALAKDPDARFQSADDFMQALPDVPAPNNRAQPARPTATLVPQPTAGAERVGPSGTVALERPPPPTTAGPTGTLVLEGRPAPEAIACPTVWDVAATATPIATEPSPPPEPSSSAKSSAAHELPAEVRPAQARPAEASFKRRPRTEHPVVIAALVATLVLGALVHHAHRRQASMGNGSLVSADTRFTPAPVTAMPAPNSTEPVVPPPAVSDSAKAPAAEPSADVAAATTTTVPPPMVTPADRSDPVRPDWESLSGTWGGEYVDASGKQVLRVVSLNISRVYDDGGIDGTLRYEAASGEGECQLRPRGSGYSVGAQRLQLSPEGCSPHHPKELGVPLDFVDVNPRTNTLKDGRVEAPTGEIIRVKLRRLPGV